MASDTKILILILITVVLALTLVLRYWQGGKPLKVYTYTYEM